MVDKFRKKLGEAVTSADTYVVGDIAKVGEGLCWPCVNMKWDLGKEAGGGGNRHSASCFSHVFALGRLY